MFIDSYGLVNSRPDEKNAENSILWTIVLFVAMKKKRRDTEHIERRINIALELMHLDNGRYKQNPAYPHPENHDNQAAYMSHDQITAIMVFYKMTKQDKKRKEMLDYFKFGISYDNVHNTMKRVMHPRDLIFYHCLDNNPFAILMLPLLWLITIHTFIKDTKTRKHGTFQKTDGEILYYIKRECTCFFKPIDWFCNMRIKQRFGSWDRVFSKYFKYVQHPINKIKNK